nr:replication factor A carboxy-terminal domain protein [Tanacetum cinerariifolium]
MTIKITPLQEITLDKGKINITVKVLSLWNQYYSNNNPSKLYGIDIILMDEQGTKIHTTINSSIVYDFDTLIKENDYQIISNFNVKRNVDSTKLNKHEFKIQFYKKTNVRNCSEFSCNDDGMNFISFKDFVEAKIDQSYSFGVSQVSNFFAGSKLLINEDNPHIKAFKDMFDTTNLSSNEKSKVELSSNTIVRKPKDYYSQFLLKSINELYELSEPTGCVVIGKVLKIVNDQGWYYTVCSNCNNVVKPLDAQQKDKNYNCENCKKMADLYLRIKIQIRVQDESGSASFCVFQTEVAKLLGKSVAYLISKIDKESESDTFEKVSTTEEETKRKNGDSQEKNTKR